MKNNKVLMSMMIASISAIASAPALAKTVEKNADSSKNVIDLSKITTNPMQLTAVQLAAKKEIKEQVSSLLTKKKPLIKISESVDILVENYGNKNGAIKQEILAEIFKGAKFAQTQDSTTQGGTGVYDDGVTCHSVCHGVCHSACHGARGWR